MINSDDISAAIKQPKLYRATFIPAKETVSQFVIPAKTRVAGAIRNLEICEMTPFSWIPDLTTLRSVRPE